MEFIIYLLISISYIMSIIINIWQYLNNIEIKNDLQKEKEYIKKWLNEEVNMKRIYCKLSYSLISDRNKYRNNFLNLYKKYKRVNRHINSFINWRISKDIFLSKIKK